MCELEDDSVPYTDDTPNDSETWMKKIKINPKIDEKARGGLMEIFRKYSKVFFKSESDFGRTNAAEHEIDTG